MNIRLPLIVALTLLALAIPGTSKSEELRLYDGEYFSLFVDPSPETIVFWERYAGTKPSANRDGSFKVVIDHLKETLDDASSLEFVRWAGAAPVHQGEGDAAYYWAIRVKFRSKNRLGALQLEEYVYLVQRDQIATVMDLNGDLGPALRRRFPSGAFPGEEKDREKILSADVSDKTIDALIEGFSAAVPSGTSGSFPGFGTAPMVPGVDRTPPASADGLSYSYDDKKITIYGTPYGDVSYPLERAELESSDSGQIMFRANQATDDLLQVAQSPMVGVRTSKGKIEAVFWDSAPVKERSKRVSRDRAKPASTPGPRVFKDASGRFEIRAILIGTVNGRVILQKDDGTEIVVKLETLSDEDRKFIESNQ